MKRYKDFITERCWPGHKPVPGKKPYSPGSCVKEEVAVNESDDLGPVKKKPKTVLLVHKTSGREKVIHDTPENRKKNAELGFHPVKEEAEIQEDWQKVNKADRTDGLSQKAVNAYRRENPGSKLQTAVTEKNPKGKRASRRKSFCSRMGGMKKRLTNPENARDPDSPINKALRRWNC